MVVFELHFTSFQLPQCLGEPGGLGGDTPCVDFSAIGSGSATFFVSVSFYSALNNAFAFNVLCGVSHSGAKSEPVALLEAVISSRHNPNDNRYYVTIEYATMWEGWALYKGCRETDGSSYRVSA